MALSTHDIDYLRTIVQDATANTIAPRQEYLIKSRLASVAAEAGLDSIEALVKELRKTTLQTNLKDHFAESMTINETSFFRDSKPFDVFRANILPRLVKAKERDAPISIWSAACASGQEPYSIGMAIMEEYPQLATKRISIHATDISNEMLDKTRAGIYSKFDLKRGLPDHLVRRYFSCSGDSWQINDNIRQMVKCQRLNLAGTWPNLPKFDIVFLRNVMIYFNEPTKIQILKNVRRQMANDSFLILGGGETLIGMPVPFKATNLSGLTCYEPS